MVADLRQFRCFLMVVEELNFTVAARRLYVTQQTLSRTISQLEREVGASLFRRTTRRVELTAAGAAMVPAARRAVEEADGAIEAARFAGTSGGPLRVDISSGSIETGALVLRELRARRPALGIHQVEIGVDRALSEIRRGQLDLVLGLAPSDLEGIEAELVRREPILVGMAQDHPLAEHACVSVARLEGHDLLLPAPEAAREWLEFVQDFCRRAGVSPRPWRHITHGSAAAAEILRESRCLVPTNAWTDPPPDLVFRPLIDPTPLFAWSMMWKSDSLSAHVRDFLDSARAVARRERWLTGDPAAVRPDIHNNLM